MDRSNVLSLIAQTYQMDDIGQQIPVETVRDVFCNISSISRAEWYQAGQAGIKPEYRVTVFAYDYQNEILAELNGVRYGIYRTYMIGNESIELYLERKAGV